MARLASVTPGTDQPKPAVEAPAALPQLPPDCNFLCLLANSPAAAEGYRVFANALANAQLSARQRELLALTVAEINGSKYCLAAHSALARRAGLTEDEIRYARKATAPDPKNDAMLRFAQALTLQRGEISEADFKSLRQARFTDGQITEIIAHVALNIFTNYFNRAAGTELDFPAAKTVS
jgi:uncharacterized peroxidase-related enzyme